MSQLTPSFESNQVYNFERIKSKHLYKMAYGDLKLINYKKHSLKKKTLIIMGLIEVSFLILAITTEIWPIAIFMTIFNLIIGGLIYGTTKGKLASRFKRISLMGLISKSMRNSSYKVTTYLDTREKTSNEFQYRSTRSPYSGKRKHYYYQHFLSYDTNLKNMNPNIDGVKLKVDSFLKTKTKSGSVVREILTVKIKFFFRMDHIMSQESFNALLHQLRYEAEVPMYQSEVYIFFPDNETILFKLKIITPIEQFSPLSIPPLIQDFWNDINVCYNHVVKRKLIPLKGTKGIPLEAEKKAQDSVSVTISKPASHTTPIKESNLPIMEKQEVYTPIRSPANSKLDDVLKNLSISLDKYEKTQDANTTIITFKPEFNYFKDVIIRVSDYIQMEFTSMDNVKKKLNFSIDIPSNELVYDSESEKPRDDLLKKYRIKRFIEDAARDQNFENVIVKTSDHYSVTIMLNSAQNNPDVLESGVNFAKSLLQEMKFIY
ncbi:MAG: hypothetical protein INQ03_02345 [Candidatus Heimdallarchaeota archaeon]|nr:hypothetical protein [Candidatus Heimdallarchaeota archaeon]